MANTMARRNRDNQTISRPGGTLHYSDGQAAVHNAGQSWKPGVDYSAEAEKYAQQGDWDAVQDVLDRRQDKMDATGSSGGGRSNLDVWNDLKGQYGGGSSSSSNRGSSSGTIQNESLDLNFGPEYGGYREIPQPVFQSAESYLRDLYQSKKDAELAGLKAMYDKNVGTLKTSQEGLGDIYADQRNQLAGLNDQQRMQMVELGVGQGLNSGATGQLAVSQSSAYQRQMGELAQQEAADRMKHDQALRDLETAYNQNVVKTGADLDAAMLDAIVRDKSRTDDLNMAQQRYAEEAARDEARREEDQRRWQAQFDAGMKESDRQAALDRAKFLAENGDMSGYADIGWLPQEQTPAAKPGGPAPRRQNWNNDDLKPDQVRQLQAMKPELVADGLWGPASREAFGGLTASEAWNRYGLGSGPAPAAYGAAPEPQIDMNSVIQTVGGAVSPQKLAELEAQGVISSYEENGVIKFRPGPAELPPAIPGIGLKPDFQNPLLPRNWR